MKKIILSFTVVSLLNTVLFAQTEDKKWSLGADIGVLNYNGDISNNIISFGGKTHVGYGLTLSRYINRSFDWFLSGNYGFVSDVGYEESVMQRTGFVSVVTMGNLGVKYKILKEKWITPYLFGDLGFFRAKISSDLNPDDVILSPSIGGGLGVDFRLAPSFSVSIKHKYDYLFTDKLDARPVEGINDQLGFTTIGLNYLFGKKKDRDGDGVADRKDVCPDVFGIEKFNGCPDTDGDGIKDSEDACPTVAGIEKFNGCPDTDGDGIKDSEDACPEVVGTLNGCPDADGDGVKDSEDECPEVAGSLNGCPDKDNDGIADKDDACPSIAGTLNGCPDTDNDGVADNKDKCPNVAGVASNNGCPLDKQDEVVIPVFDPVYFDINSTLLKANATDKLNKIVEAMKANTLLKATVSGHADNLGEPSFNKTLSVQRAMTVKNYLIRKGIDGTRVGTQAFGETKPVGPNTTPEGRAKNRRVETVLSK